MEIIKSSGEKEAFSREKFCSSLEKTGATRDVVEAVCKAVEKTLTPGITTSEIFRTASQHLLKENPKIGIRYNLKKGIMELGPAGFRFEQYVEAIVRSLGYETQRDIIMQGECVSHEIDVLAHKGDLHYLMEMKYRNDLGTKTGIEVAMYAYARLLDIIPIQEKREQEKKEHRMWIVTNAKFTGKAIQFGECRKIKMTGWSYPKGHENLESIARDNLLYPVTVLPSVDHFSREAFARFNMILAQDIIPYTPEELEKEFGIHRKKAEQIVRDAELLIKGD